MLQVQFLTLLTHVCAETSLWVCQHAGVLGTRAKTRVVNTLGVCLAHRHEDSVSAVLPHMQRDTNTHIHEMLRVDKKMLTRNVDEKR